MRRLLSGLMAGALLVATAFTTHTCSAEPPDLTYVAPAPVMPSIALMPLEPLEYHVFVCVPSLVIYPPTTKPNYPLPEDVKCRPQQPNGQAWRLNHAARSNC